MEAFVTPIEPVIVEGSTLSLRPVLPDDKRLLRDAFEHLSERSRRQRFLTPTPTLTRGQVAYLTEIDHHDHVAFGVLDGDLPVAVGRWIRFDHDPEAADVGVTVIDRYQARGIGVMLIEVLALAARHRRVRWLHFDVLASNHPMLRLLDRFGANRTDFGPIIHAVIDVEQVRLPHGISDALVRQLDQAALLAG